MIYDVDYAHCAAPLASKASGKMVRGHHTELVAGPASGEVAYERQS